MPETGDDTASLVFRVIIPESELRIFEARKENLAKVQWIPSPGIGHVQIVECYLTPIATGRESTFPFAHFFDSHP